MCIFLKLSFSFSLALDGSLVSHFPPLIYLRCYERLNFNFSKKSNSAVARKGIYLIFNEFSEFFDEE